MNGPADLCERYVMASGDYIIEDVVTEGMEVYCPIGHDRFMENGTFHGAGAFDLLFPLIREAERLIKHSGIEYTIVRPSVIFGADDSFFNRFAGLLKWLPILPLACPGAQLQPVWVGDVANAVAVILEKRETIGRAYSLVGPGKYSLIDLVRFTAKATEKKRWILGLPDFVSRLQGVVCDFVPGKPFSSDNYRSLKIDNVSDENGLRALGIEPRPLEGLVKSYLCGSSRQQRLDTIRQRTDHRP